MRTFSFFFLLPAFLSSPLVAAPKSAVVLVPVADVWSRPLPRGTTGIDEWRETQILQGEKVLIHRSSGSWVRIEAVEQQEFTHRQQWEGYPGWVSRQSVGDATPHVLPAKKSGQEVIRLAASYLNSPYLWGGLTSAGGFDCSGLVHWVYRQSGHRIPRDAHEQWMKARPIRRAELLPGDLIFSARRDAPEKITHVAIYLGDGNILEAPQTGMIVRTISFQDKYGHDLSRVDSGQMAGERLIYFGTYLH